MNTVRAVVEKVTVTLTGEQVRKLSRKEQELLSITVLADGSAEFFWRGYVFRHHDDGVITCIPAQSVAESR